MIRQGFPRKAGTGLPGEKVLPDTHEAGAGHYMFTPTTCMA